MNIVDRIALFFGKRILRKYTKKNFSIYKQYESMIEDCYKNVEYWHGTGRYHYSYSGKSKYEGIKNNNYIDVLLSIINEGGLAPHFDPWIPVEGKIGETTSLTRFRMYARLYAEIHQYEKNNFEYEYGSLKFWFVFLLIFQIRAGKFLRNIKNGYHMFTSRKFKNDSQVWMKTLRKDLDRNPVKLHEFYNLRSDILLNYGLLFGIRNSIATMPLDEFTKRFETRTNKKITFDDMSHIEVPLANLQETQKLFDQYNITLQILPIEFGELYMSKKDLKNLVIFH